MHAAKEGVLLSVIQNAHGGDIVIAHV
jgi:hypothetical protein